MKFDMELYRITYFMYPYENIVVTIWAKDFDDACVYAKTYRNDSFSIDKVER